MRYEPGLLSFRGFVVKRVGWCLLVLAMAGVARAEEERGSGGPRLTLFAQDDNVDNTADLLTGMHLGWSLRSPELMPGLRVEAELSLLAAASAQGVLGLRDNASFVRLVWRDEAWAETEGLSLSLLPLSSTRLHLGYEFPATWGRYLYTYQTGNPGSVPGLELRLSRAWGDVFLAAKSATAANERTRELDRVMTGLAGAGVNVSPWLRLEVAGAFAEHGEINPLAMVDPLTEHRSETLGVSGRVLFHRGVPIGPSVDVALYQRDPALYETLFAPEAYPDGVSVSVSLEGTHLAQTLVVFGEDVVSTRPSSVGADVLALQARLKVDRLRVHALALHRSATFLMAEVPGLPAFQFPAPDRTQADVLLTVGADYHVARWALTPGLLVRAQLPAVLEGSDTLASVGVPARERQFVVLRGPNSLNVLPPGSMRRPVWLGKATLRRDLGSSIAAVGEVFYTRDPNQTEYEDDDLGVARPVLRPVSAWGFSLFVQARF